MRATSETLAPGASDAATSRSFSSCDQRRRRSTDVITSAREIVIALLLGLPVSGARTARWRDYGRVLNRVGIQYWRVNSTAAGIALGAERRSMSTLSPIGADGIIGRPWSSTQWNRIGNNRAWLISARFLSGAQADSLNFIAA